MKIKNIMILPVLLSFVSSSVFAGVDKNKLEKQVKKGKAVIEYIEDNSGDMQDEQPDDQNDYEPQEFVPDYNLSGGYGPDFRFFIGLNTPLLSYNQQKIEYKDLPITKTYNETRINYDVFDNASFVFGIDSPEGFRVSVGITHYNTQTKITGMEDTDSTGVGLGLTLDIPFVKQDTTSPFLRLGMGYVSVEDDDMDISFPMFDVGLGVTHNFSQNVFGVLALQYTFMHSTDISEYDASYTEKNFSAVMGIGYRF